jgi:AraC-like DNA-binding protein
MRQLFYPRKEELKRCIRYISFHESEDDERKFLVFPNPGSAIGLHKEHGFISTEKNTYQTINLPGQHIQLLHLNRVDPVKVSDKGKREVITIVFKSFGVNHFIHPENLSDLVAGNHNDPSFINLVSFKDFAKKVFAEKSHEGQLEVIEEYLADKLREIKIPCVEEAIELLSDLDKSYSIPAICKQIGTSPRNLARLFNKHICVSPVEFRNIYQFRYSLNKKTEAGEKVHFKDIGYESNYSHSSYMIRMYKKYTGLNPSAFFDKVSIESNYVFMSL